MTRAVLIAGALATGLAAPSAAWAAKANKPPAVTLTSPAAGQVFTAPATITLAATASDPNGVARVDFYRGSTLIGSDTMAPYTLEWANVPVGSYSLTATATDTLGAVGTSAAVSVSVVAPVSALITSPANGAALYGASVTVSGTFNGDPTTTSVLVDNGNTTRMAVPSGNNFSVSLPLLRGSNTITVVAARHDRTFDTYSVTVTGNDAPYVAFRSPAAGAHDAPASLELEAEALSPGGSISRVEFLIDGSLRGTDTTAPYQYTWVNPPFGSHTLTARAFDDNDATAVDTRSVTINSPNTLPNVVLTAPADGAVFQAPASITLQASASDPDGSIVRVEFLRDGAVIFTDTTAPYSFTWTNVPQGSYALAARAVDNRSGVATSATATVTVTPPNVAPTVSLDAPPNGAEYTSPVNILLTASAADSDGTVMWVEFYSGTTLLGTDSTPPYSYAWNSVFAGTYALRARAIDNVGVATDSAVATITVSDPPPNDPPTVSVSASASEVYGPTTVTLTATAADSDGSVAKVDFYADGSLLGTDDTAPYAFDWTSAPAGTYAITAVATDDLGAVATSAPVSVTIKALALTITTPSDGVLLVDDHVIVSGTIDAPFNSGVTVNGQVAAVVGNQFHANTVLGAGSNTITATLTTPAGQTLQSSITVTSDGASPFLNIGADKLEGVVPMDVTFTVENPTDVDAEVVFGGSSAFTVPAGSSIPVTISYGTPTVDTVQFSASNAAGQSMAEEFIVVAYDPVAIDQTFNAVWNGMNGALLGGNKTAAMAYLSESAQATYGPVFDVLMSEYAQIASTWSPPLRGSLSRGLAEYAIVTTTPNGDHVFLVYLIRGKDGIWRLDSM